MRNGAELSFSHPSQQPLQDAGPGSCPGRRSLGWPPGHRRSVQYKAWGSSPGAAVILFNSSAGTKTCQTRVLVFVVFLEQQGCYYKCSERQVKEAKRRSHRILKMA
jgi:hypothetical protein